MSDHHDIHDTSDHQSISELLVPYALGQLDETDAERVRSALDSNAELRSQLRDIEDIGARLVGSVHQVAAPPALRARVLDAVGVAGSSDVARIEAATTVQAPRGVARRPRRRLRFAMPVFAGACAAACVALAVATINLDNELDDVRSDLRAAQSQQDGPPVGFENTAVHDVTTNGDMAPASGSLLHVGGEQWLLVLRDVPDPGPGNSWQVWTADSRGDISNVAQWMHGGETYVLPLDSGDITEVMVSFEHTRDPMPAPSGAPVADVKV